ncbi:MAG: DUF4271 domain-containing protein [Crocinitomicaceae bacterium]
MFSQIGLNFFGNTTEQWVNMTLHPKTSLFGSYSFFFLILSLLLIVLAKNANTRSFEVVFQLFFRSRKIESRIRENWPVFGTASWFLTLNFIITLAHSLFLLLQKQGITENVYLILISMTISFGFFFLAFISMFIIGTLTGLSKIYQIPMQLTWVLPQFVGLVFFLINLIWVLNPLFSDNLIYLFLLFFILLSLQRIVRSSFYLLSSRVEWYYILLYLCTLEIMPLAILVWFLYEWIV